MPVISGITRAVVQDIIDKIKQKATAPAWNQDTDSLEALREILDALDSELDQVRQKATAPAWNQDTDSLEALREILDALDSELDQVRQKATAPAWDQDKHSLEAIREAIDALSKMLLVPLCLAYPVDRSPWRALDPGTTYVEFAHVPYIPGETATMIVQVYRTETGLGAGLRLYNSTDAVTLAEFTDWTGATILLLESSSFTLPAANKRVVIQVKGSSTTEDIYIYSAFLKIT